MHAYPFLVLSFPPLGASLWQDLRASQINVHLCCPEVGSFVLLSSLCCFPHLLRNLLEVSAQQARLLFGPLPHWDVSLAGPVLDLGLGCPFLDSSCHCYQLTVKEVGAP